MPRKTVEHFHESPILNVYPSMAPRHSLKAGYCSLGCFSRSASQSRRNQSRGHGKRGGVPGKEALQTTSNQPSFLGLADLWSSIHSTNRLNRQKGFFHRIRAACRGFRSQEARVPSNIRRKKFFRLAFHTGRATARSPAATEIRVSRPLRAAGTFFLHALM